jgi:hypothetical protein
MEGGDLMTAVAIGQPRDALGRWRPARRKPVLTMMSPGELNTIAETTLFYFTTAAAAYKWAKKNKKKRERDKKRNKYSAKNFKGRKVFVAKKDSDETTE